MQASERVWKSKNEFSPSRTRQLAISVSSAGMRVRTHPCSMLGAEPLQTFSLVVLAGQTLSQYSFTYLILVTFCIPLASSQAVTSFVAPLPIELVTCETVVIFMLLKFAF